MAGNRRSSLPASPAIGSKRSRVNRRSSLLCRLPADNGCTLLPALTSLDSLMPRESQVMSVSATDGDDEIPSPQISPRASLRLQELEATWHIVVLGRSFQNLSVEQVACALMQELGMECDSAREKARAASSVKAFVVETSKFCSDASFKVESLRRRGLSVSVTSQSGLPASALDVSPKKPDGKRSSYSDLFRKAGNEFQRRMSSLSVAPRTKTEVAELPDANLLEADPTEKTWKSEGSPCAPAKRSLRSLISKHKVQIMEEAAKIPKSKASKFDSNASIDSTASTGSRHPSKSRQKLLSAWDQVLDTVEVDIFDKKNTQSRKDACELIRFLIFGEVFRSEHERDYKFHLSVGCKDDMLTLMPFWATMDNDKTGRVDHGEFRASAVKRFRWQFLEKEGEALSPLLSCPTEENLDKFVNGLCEKIAAHVFGKKSFMSLEDVMKLTWLRATPPDLKSMKGWCKEASRDPGILRVSAPPVLPQSEYGDLASIYHHFDTDGEGHMTFERLVEVGLLHDYQIPQAKADWDEDGNGTLELQEFCEMMCPPGFRALATSVIGSRKDGTRVLYDEGISGWRVERKSRVPLDMAESVLTRTGSNAAADAQVQEVNPAGFSLRTS